jgi:exopolyphosphatase/guanosine-5'-triphosphate,3'-diphosphate pyrophosphatase
MKRVSVIDVGSNSVRLLVARVDEANIQPLYKTLRSTRLGAGVDANRVLSSGAMESTLGAVRDFKEKSISMGADEVLAVATSAVRDASNGEDLIREIGRLGIRAWVLDGRQEAELGFVGAALGCDAGKECIFLADIGGGSTELVTGMGFRVHNYTSLDIGAVRLTERFVRNDPVTPAEASEIEYYVMDILAQSAKDITAGDCKMIGIGGTITTLAAIAQGMEHYDSDRVHNFVLTLSEVKCILEKLAALDISEKKKIPGLHPGRADIINAGAIILKCLMEHWGFECITVSEWDGLQGVIYQNFIRVHQNAGRIPPQNA